VGSGGIDFPAFDDTPGLDDTTVDFDVPTDDEWATGGYTPIGPDVSQPAGEPSGGQTPVGGWDNPADSLEQSLDQTGVGVITGNPYSGETLSVAESDFTCAGQVCWSKINKDTGAKSDISCQDEPIAGSWDLSITTDEIDHYIVATGRCKDPSTASGWGPPQVLGQTAAIQQIGSTLGYYRLTYRKYVTRPTTEYKCDAATETRTNPQPPVSDDTIAYMFSQQVKTPSVTVDNGSLTSVCIGQETAQGDYRVVLTAVDSSGTAITRNREYTFYGVFNYDPGEWSLQGAPVTFTFTPIKWERTNSNGLIVYETWDL
jgi:hypothetical protein